MRLPNSKMNTAKRYVHFRVKYLNSLPQDEVNEATVRKKADPYQPIWDTLWKSSVIFGMAVATMVCSQDQHMQYGKIGSPYQVQRDHENR